MKKTMYLHASKSSNIDMGREIGLSEEALVELAYALYEVEVEVDVETGKVEIIQVNRINLEK